MQIGGRCAVSAVFLCLGRGERIQGGEFTPNPKGGGEGASGGIQRRRQGGEFTPNPKGGGEGASGGIQQSRAEARTSLMSRTVISNFSSRAVRSRFSKQIGHMATT
jgi:hypothetical protein